MKIEYFTFDNPWCDERYISGWRKKNYSTLQKAIDICLANYKPNFRTSIKSFQALTYKKEIVTKDILSSRKNKKGVYPVISQTKEERTVLDKDFTKYRYSKEEMKKVRWGEEEKAGFFETKFGESVQTIEDETITWKAQVFVKFFDAKREFQCEVKEAGKPYQPEREEIVVLGEASDWLPMYCTKNTEPKFGLHNNLDGWFVTSEYWVEDKIYISKQTLEIHE